MHNPRRSEYPSISSGKDYRDCDIPPDFSLEELQLEPESGDRYRTVSIEFQIQIVDVLFIFSSGSRSAGKVTVTSSPDQLPGAADIRITAKHMFEGVLDQARVLLMCMGERSKGVGIFTPRSHARSTGLAAAIEFEVTITLPEGTESRPFKIPRFHGDTPGMRYTFNTLVKISLGEVQISCNNSDIRIGFLRAHKGTFTTTNGSIRGHLESTGKILCRTTNGSIHVEATLISGNSDVALIATTTNSDIKAGIRAFSTSNPGAYRVRVETTNGPVDVNFNEAPALSSVELKAVTTNAPATACLPATFDGKFLARTTNSEARAIFTTQTAERGRPIAEGRKVYFDMNKSLRGDRVTGRVGCTEDRKAGNTGDVHVETSNSPATINLRYN